jgi:CheY-like chemotaxis protein
MSTLKIVVVDDDMVIGRAMVRWLQSHAYHAFQVADSSQAASTIRIYRPDVVLLDVLMPGISGPDLASLLRQTPETNDAAIILVSGMEAHELQALAVRTGALGGIQKTHDEQAFLHNFQQLTAGMHRNSNRA